MARWWRVGMELEYACSPAYDADFLPEHDKTLVRVMTAVIRDDTELFKQFMDNEELKRWMTDARAGIQRAWRLA
jgi:hypothetical protein